jgi:hypothetical protein
MGFSPEAANLHTRIGYARMLKISPKKPQPTTQPAKAVFNEPEKSAYRKK